MCKEVFIEKIQSSYKFNNESIVIGSAIYESDYDTNTQVKLPLKTMNRHGLIAGATGTGKTKTLQVLAESLSEAGVPVLVMDSKGDLSGLGAVGEINKHITKRANYINIEWEGKSYPLEFLSVSDEPGVKLKATISEYGPVLLSKILGLNENQAGVLSMIFKFCDDRNLPLLDFKDLKTVLNYIQSEGKEDFRKEYGFIHSSSAGAILRNIIRMQQQKVDSIFGEPSFEVLDLMENTEDNKGVVNVLRLTDMQSRPDVFSTFMLCLIAELFQKMPEQGDIDKPKLVLFIDEAHLIFKNASQTLIDQLEMTVKLIRSKGVGLFFVTQSPNDIPAGILGQLGTKVQHALRAFTAKDRKAIKLASENYPYTEFYKVDQLITELGIGEAFVSTLDEKGRPTELVHTLIRPPYSRMDVLNKKEITTILNNSNLISEYNQEIDRESAHEILREKIQKENKKDEEIPSESSSIRKSKKSEQSTFEKILKNPLTKSIVMEVMRGVLGVLGLRTTRRKSTRRKK